MLAIIGHSHFDIHIHRQRRQLQQRGQLGQRIAAGQPHPARALGMWSGKAGIILQQLAQEPAGRLPGRKIISATGQLRQPVERLVRLPGRDMALRQCEAGLFVRHFNICEGRVIGRDRGRVILFAFQGSGFCQLV